MLGGSALEQLLLIRVITLKEGKQMFWVCGAKQYEPDTFLVPARSAGPVGVWMCGGRFTALLFWGQPEGQEEPVCCESAGQLQPQPLSCLLLRGICQRCQWFGQFASGFAARPSLKVFLMALGYEKELLEWELQLWCMVCSKQLRGRSCAVNTCLDGP